jgi:PAS domain S-box-containing protein
MNNPQFSKSVGRSRVRRYEENSKDTAERRQVEEALRESEVRYAAVVENSPIGFWHTDAEGRTVYVNPAMCALLEVERPEELAGWTWHSFFTPESLKTVECEHVKRLKGLPSVYEVEILGKHGTRRHVVVHGAPLMSPGGELKGTMGAFLDITDRKRAEEAVRLNEARLEALSQLVQLEDKSLHELADFALEASVRLTKSRIGYFAFLNEEQTVLNMYAWSAAALAECGVKDRTMVYPVETTGLWGEAVRQRRPVITNDYEAPNPWKRGMPQGHVRVKRHMNVPVFDGDRIVIVAGVGNKEEAYNESDVRQLTLLMDGLWKTIRRRQVQEALRDSEERFRSTFEQAAVGIAHVSPSGRWLRVNQRLCEIVGYTREELLQRRFHDVTHPDDRETDLATAGQMLAGEIQTYSQEKRYIRKDGTVIWIHPTVSLLREPSGKPKYFIVVVQDVTDRKRAEQEKEVLETQLRQAQKMEAIGQLAGGVAHDFNNLLQAISGYTHLTLADLESGHPACDNLNEVIKAAEIAASLVRQLLAVSRRQPVRAEPLDLNEVIAGTLKMIGRLLGEDVELVFHPRPVIKPVHADAGNIEQIIMNLCVNARDAMPEGGRLCIETGMATFDAAGLRRNPYAREGEFVMFAVSDTGVGMSPEVRDRIFEPFYTTKELGKGTGLGLATVYGIVRQHNGFIHVYSEPGMGSVFRVYLPAERAETPANGNQTEKQVVEPGRGETILLAEDDELVRDLAAAVLRQGGYQVVTARDGQQAIGLFHERPSTIDLVLVDVVLPKKSGRAVYDAVRATRPDIPVLFASGYSFNVLDMGSMPEEGYELVSKPFRPADLLSKVRQLLDRR